MLSVQLSVLYMSDQLAIFGVKKKNSVRYQIPTWGFTAVSDVHMSRIIV